MANHVPITELKPGESARVVSLPNESSYLRKLTSFGILPGVEVEVLQVSPAYVLCIEYTQLAVDFEVARRIIVEK